jgi:hypothetical protein
MVPHSYYADAYFCVVFWEQIKVFLKFFLLFWCSASSSLLLPRKCAGTIS